jgi:hypothetical protein
MRTRSVAALLLTAVLAVPLAACEGEAGDSGASPSPTGEATGSLEPTPIPSGSLPTLPTRPPLSPPVEPPPSDRSGLVTLTGEVFAGVEAGCVLLATDSGDYLLIGSAAESLGTGQTVTVRGVVRANLATTCQQGTPFEVSEVLD